MCSREHKCGASTNAGMVSVLGPLFCTAGHLVRTQHGVTASAGQRCSREHNCPLVCALGSTTTTDMCSREHKCPLFAQEHKHWACVLAGAQQHLPERDGSTISLACARRSGSHVFRPRFGSEFIGLHNPIVQSNEIRSETCSKNPLTSILLIFLLLVPHLLHTHTHTHTCIHQHAGVLIFLLLVPPLLFMRAVRVLAHTAGLLPGLGLRV
jgi:hypothetical protein